MHYNFLQEFDQIIENFANMHFKSHAFEFKVLLKTVILSNEKFSKEMKNLPSLLFYYVLRFYEDLKKLFVDNEDYKQFIESFLKSFVNDNYIRDVSQEEFLIFS